VLTVDNLSLLQVLLQEFNTAIDTSLHLLIGAYLHGDVVPEREKVSFVKDNMPAIQRWKNYRSDSLCNSNQLRETEIIAGHNDWDVSRDDTSLVDDGSLQHTFMCLQPVKVLCCLGLCSGNSSLVDVFRVRRLRVRSGRKLYVALHTLVGVLRDTGHLTRAEGHRSGSNVMYGCVKRM